MDSDRNYKSKRDDRKKDRKKKSHSKSSGSRSRSSSRSSSHVRKRKGKKSTHEGSEKYSSKHREPREEIPNEEDYRRNMMGFQGYPMMFDGKMKQNFDMGGPMMPFGGMRGGFPPAFPMSGYPMFRPPMFPPGIPPMPNSIEMPPMQKMNRMGVKTFMDPKAAPLTKKDKEKTVKKEEDNGKVIDFPQPMHTAEIFKSLQLSVKHSQEPLLLFTAKNVLTDVENKLRDKKLKGRAKEVSEFLSGVYDKIKDIEKKDKKKTTTSTSTETSKISELDVVNALNETEDIKAFLSLVNLEKFSLDSFYEPDIIHVKESEESAALFEEVKSLFLSSKDGASQNV